MNLIDQHIAQVNQLCQKHKVASLYAFGSVLRADFNEKSDIDMVVKFGNVELLAYADNYFDLKFSLENLLNREIDLLEEQAIKNVYLKNSIENTKTLIYAR